MPGRCDGAGRRCGPPRNDASGHQADYEVFHFNTWSRSSGAAILLRRVRRPEWDEAVRLLLLILAPAAPHITEELWSRGLARRGGAWSSIHTETWPEVDLAVVAESTREVPSRSTARSRPDHRGGDADAATIEQAALASAKVQAILAGRARIGSSRPAAVARERRRSGLRP